MVRIMAIVDLSNEQRKRLIDIIAQYGDIGSPRKRQNFLENTGLSDAAPERISTIGRDGTTRDFAQELVRICQSWGTLKQTQQPALMLVIQYLRDEVVSGHEEEAHFLDALLSASNPVVNHLDRLKIFISYRRKSWAFTQRLANDIAQRLNADVFVDIQSLDSSNFEQSILYHVRKSDVVLVVVTEYTFSERIHDTGDWVRREIAEALRLKKPIITVAVDGLYPPTADQLPTEIADIGRMQGVPFYAEPEYWDGAMQRLVGFVGKVTRAPVVQSKIVASPSNTNVLKDRYNRAMDLLDADEWDLWDRAILMLEELRSAGFRQKFVDLDTIMAEAVAHRNLAIRRIEMLEAYQNIARLAKSKITVLQARKAWIAFKKEYELEFDLNDDIDNLTEKLKFVVPSPGLKRALLMGESIQYITLPTDEQERLLGIMLDISIPPPQRAEAGRELAKIGDPRRGVGILPNGLPDIVWCEVPGRDKGHMPSPIGGDSQAYNSLPGIVIDLPTFWIAKYPITFAQYQTFIDDQGYNNAKWWYGLQRVPPEMQGFQFANHPRENISQYDMIAYCRWLTEKFGVEIRLPTEEEWEKTARGGQGFYYPWGNEYQSGRANVNEQSDRSGYYYLGSTTPVGMYPHNASPYDVMDMSGNVWEWTSATQRAWRGGAWDRSRQFSLAASRHNSHRGDRDYNLGARIVCTSPPPKPRL